MRRLLIVFAFLLLPTATDAQVPQGCTSGFTPGFITCIDGAYTHADLTSAGQLITGPGSVALFGQVTPGDVVGFNYAFTYGDTRYNLPFRHTMTAGDTFSNVMNDLTAQFKANSQVSAAIGADILSYALVRQPTPSYWFLQFFQNWALVSTGNPTVTIYLSPGATEQGLADAGNGTLEVNPYTACGRTAIGAGRQPQAGDMLCGHYITGDATGQPLDQRNVNPTYGQIVDNIIDPTPGVVKMKRSMVMDTLDLVVDHLLVRGQPIGPVGTQGPPGGNIAGSIMQSPALTQCADQNQTGNNCSYTRVYKFAGLTISGWTTVATLTPSNVAGSWSMSKMKVEAVTNTHGLGFGSLESQAWIGINNGPPTGNYIGSNICNQSCAQFRFIVSGNAVQVQIAAPAGGGYIASGFAKIEYLLSDAEGNPVTWTIQ